MFLGYLGGGLIFVDLYFPLPLPSPDRGDKIRYLSVRSDREIWNEQPRNSDNLGVSANISAATMVGIKRKQNASSGTKSDHIKKRKHTSPPAVESSTSSNLEAETDSDPIMESDTTEHSGDGDGVSWPSDQDEDIQDEKEEGAGVRHKSLRQTGPMAAPETTNGTSSWSSTAILSCPMLIAIRHVKGVPCQAESSSPRTQSRQAKRRLYSEIQEALGTLTKEVSRAAG